MALTDNLVSYWKLNDNATDEQGASNGTAYGNTNYVAGKFGKAANFDGNGDYISTPHNTNAAFTTDLSISAWFYLDDAASIGQKLVTKRGSINAHGGFELSWEGSNQHPDWDGLGLGVTFTNGPGTEANMYRFVPMTTGAWHHVVGTWDHDESGDSGNDRIKMYVDGQPVAGDFISYSSYGAIPVGTPMDANTLPVRIGGNELKSRWLDGKLDDIAIWNRKLSAQDALDIYNAGNAGNPLSTLFAAAVDGSGISITVV